MPRNEKAGRSKKIGAPACAHTKGPSILCNCKGCTMRRAIVTHHVGTAFPSVSVLLVAGMIEGA